MTELARLLQQTAAALGAAQARFALVGGLAVSVRTEPRFTRDIDLVVAAAGDAEAERLVAHLSSGYDVLGTLEQEVLQRLAAVRLAERGRDGTAAVVDLLFASSGIEAEVADAAEPLEVLSGVTVPVARTGHLLALKLLSREQRRPQDEIDLQALLQVATAEELELATQAIELIVARGADRERELHADWREFLGQ